MALLGDGQRCSHVGKDEQRCSDSSTMPKIAQSLAAGAGALLLSLSPLVISPPPAWPAAAPAVKYLTRDELSTVDLFKRATPSVVFVTALGERRDALTLDVTQMPQGAGSGVVWDTAGHVVTNYHVVKDATELRVTVSAGGGAASGKGGQSGGGGGEFRAKLVGADPDRDVALLQLADFADPSPEEEEEEGEYGEEVWAGMETEEEADRGKQQFGDGEGDGAGEEEIGVVPVASPSSSPSTSSSSPKIPSPRRPPPNLRPRPPLVPLRRGTSAGLEGKRVV